MFQVAAVWFGNEGNLEFDLNDLEDKATLLDGLDNIKHRGGECVCARERERERERVSV